MSKTAIITFFVAGSVLLLSFLNLFCNSPETPKKEASLYRNHSDSATYVGIETCRSCHNEIYKTFIQTGMGSSFDFATRQKSAADFKRHHVVYDKYSDLYYHPFWKNDSMYIMEYRMEGKDTVHKRVEKVDYIVGSGQHTNSHMMNVNGFLYQLPLTWYAQKKQWDLPPGFENGHNVRFNRKIGFECMSCHNALPGFVENSMNKFVSIPQGIDCERCHGPGSVHVKEKLAGIRVDTVTQIDYTIVNPKKLPWERQIDVCQRCHLQGNAVLKPGKTFRDFRPGMKLSDFMEIYMPKYSASEDEFIMASHAQRLQMSRCFLSSTKGQTHNLTCITCHNPHISVKVTGKQVFNNACGKCHDMQSGLPARSETKSGCKEKISVRMTRNDNCVSCHMPRSGTIDIPHVTVTDHWIRVPVKQKTKDDIKVFAGIYCINNYDSDNSIKAEAYLSYYEKFEGEKLSLDSADWYLKSVKGDDESLDLRVHLLFLKGGYQQITQLVKTKEPTVMSKPWFCYRVGQAYQNQENFSKAEQWYAQAVKLAGENLDFLNKYGAVLIQSGRLDEGIDVLQRSLTKNPKQSEVLTNIGFAWIQKGNQQKAMEYYDAAIALDPDMQQALLNKAALCNIQGKRSEAKSLLQRILKRDPQNEYIRQLMQGI